MNGKIKYEFSAKMWQYSSPDGWYFVSLPGEVSKEIRENLKWMEEGWGRLKVIAETGNTQWKTSIWFDTKHKTYLLPLKAEIRKKEKLDLNPEIKITVWI